MNCMISSDGSLGVPLSLQVVLERLAEFRLQGSEQVGGASTEKVFVQAGSSPSVMVMSIGPPLMG